MESEKSHSRNQAECRGDPNREELLLSTDIQLRASYGTTTNTPLCYCVLITAKGVSAVIIYEGGDLLRSIVDKLLAIIALSK